MTQLQHIDKVSLNQFPELSLLFLSLSNAMGMGIDFAQIFFKRTWHDRLVSQSG